jgi:hypothetical protein
MRKGDDGERTRGGLPGRLTEMIEEWRGLARPEQVDVWLGLDVGEEDHFAEVLDDAGERIFARGVANGEAAWRRFLTGPASMARPAW